MRPPEGDLKGGTWLTEFDCPKKRMTISLSSGRRGTRTESNLAAISNYFCVIRTRPCNDIDRAAMSDFLSAGGKRYSCSQNPIRPAPTSGTEAETSLASRKRCPLAGIVGLTMRRFRTECYRWLRKRHRCHLQDINPIAAHIRAQEMATLQHPSCL